ncbi:hypothetical protein VKT23_015786 [Stygiomarasmius scandens]|uniref:Alpha/beta hydrolase fold-3 domain-containing protein n=1 Tax=Marasmiellus scandens TaxID=2682957 RepID=A0ABR1IWQ2_9AGAR
MAFAYRHQPVKALFLALGTLSLLARLPFYLLRNLFPSWRPRRSWTLSRTVLVKLIEETTRIVLHTGLPEQESLEDLKKVWKERFVLIEPLEEKLIVGELRTYAEANRVKSERVGGFWFEKDENARVGRKAGQDEKVIVVLHGGGFVLGSGTPSFFSNKEICEGLLKHIPQISRIFAVEYRLASSAPYPVANPFPTATLDCLAGYHYLVHQVGFSSNNIIVAGDSAGGLLTYHLARYTAECSNMARELPIPGGLLLLSPTLDHSFEPRGSMITNLRSDYLSSWLEPGYSVRSILGFLPRIELQGSWLSPGLSSLSNEERIKCSRFLRKFPKTLVVVGEAEMTKDPMKTFTDRLVENSGIESEKVDYLEVDNALHDWIGMPDLGIGFMEPEKATALKYIAGWVGELWS